MTTKPSLDDALAAWAKADPLTRAGDSAALERILSHADVVAASPPVSRIRHWMLGGAVAASVALAMLLAPSFRGASGPDSAPVSGATPVMLAEADLGESAAFALLYTLTIEEEYLL